MRAARKERLQTTRSLQHGGACGSAAPAAFAMAPGAIPAAALATTASAPRAAIIAAASIATFSATTLVAISAFTATLSALPHQLADVLRGQLRHCR